MNPRGKPATETRIRDANRVLPEVMTDLRVCGSLLCGYPETSRHPIASLARVGPLGLTAPILTALVSVGRLVPCKPDKSRQGQKPR